MNKLSVMHYIKLSSISLFVYLFTHMARAEIDFSHLEKQIEEIRSSNNIVGMQVAVTNKDGILWSENFGYASIKSELPVTVDTLFRIGSTSKSFVGVAIMQLFEQGKIELEDEIEKYIPEIVINNPWKETNPIQILHLLEHTTGFDDSHFSTYLINGKNMTTRQQLDVHSDGRTSAWKPGTQMSYSSSNTLVLAYLIEKLTGKQFENYIKQNIFVPLNMNRSDYFLSELVKSKLATGYLETRRGQSEAEYEHSIGRAAGAINSNATQMSTFLRMFQGKGTVDEAKILKSSSVARMQIVESTIAARSGVQEGYGKQWKADDYKGTIWWGHGGAMNGYLSNLSHNKDSGLGYVVLLNGYGAKAFKGAKEINHLLREQLIEHSGIVAEVSTKVSKEDDYSAEIIGSYSLGTTRIQMYLLLDTLRSHSRVFLTEGKLFLDLGDQVYHLISVGRNTFRIESESGRGASVVFSNVEGNWHYQIPIMSINAVKASDYYKPASLILVGLFVLSILLVFLISLVRLIRKRLKKDVSDDPSFRWLFASNLSFFVGFAFFFLAGVTDHMIYNLGAATIWSIGLFIGFSGFGVFAIINVWLRIRHRIIQNKLLKVLLWGISTIQLAVVIVLFNFDFLFVRTWMY